ADQDVVLPRVAREERREGGEQGDEGRRPAPPAERQERTARLGRQAHGLQVAAETLHGRAGPVGREGERGGAREGLPPVADERRQDLTAEPPALPEGEVGVVDRD